MAVEALPQPRTVVINNQTYAPIANRNATRTPYQHFEEYEGTSSGAFRFIQLLAKVSTAVSMYFEYIGNSMSSLFSSMAQKLNTTWGLMGIARLPRVTREGLEALTSSNTMRTNDVTQGLEERDAPVRGLANRTGKIADFAAAWLYTGSSLLENAPLRKVADVFSAANDSADLFMAGQDYETANRLIQHVDVNNQDLMQRFKETKTEAGLRFCKALASVVGAAMGFFAIATGSALALTISLASTIFALAAHFYKETSQCTPIRFFEWTNTPNLEGVCIN